MKKILLMFAILSLPVSGQMVWNDSPLSSEVQTLEQLLTKNIPDVYEKLSSEERERIHVHYKEINKGIKDFTQISTNEYFNFKLPSWLIGKRNESAQPLDVVPVLTELKEQSVPSISDEQSKSQQNEKLSFYQYLKKINFQLGLGVQSSFIDEYHQQRRVETIQSDAMALRSRAQILISERYNITYVPQISIALSTGSYSLPVEIHLKNFILLENWHKWGVTPLTGIGIGNSGHLYVDSVSRVQTSDNKYGNVFVGGLTQFEKFNRSWNVALALNYTPYYQISRANLVDNKLSGLGYYVAMGTSFLRVLNLEIAFDTNSYSNDEIKLKNYSFTTNFLYKF